MLGVNRWAGLVFSYMEMSLKPGFTGMGLALESVMMGLGPRSGSIGANQAPETDGWAWLLSLEESIGSISPQELSELAGALVERVLG